MPLQPFQHNAVARIAIAIAPAADVAVAVAVAVAAGIALDMVTAASVALMSNKYNCR